MTPDEQHREGRKASPSAGGGSCQGRPVEPTEDERPPAEPHEKVRGVPLGMPVPEEEYRALKEEAERPVDEPGDDSSDTDQPSPDDSKED